MADLITADELALLSPVVVEDRVIRTAKVITGLATTDISNTIMRWGSLYYHLFNYHPADETSSIVITTIQMDAVNIDNLFSIGNADGLFPTYDDFLATLLEVEVKLGATQLNYFKGWMSEPIWDSDSRVALHAQHVLAEANEKQWQRSDRIGGFSGALVLPAGS